MKPGEARIRRVTGYEAMANEVSAALDALDEARERLESLGAEIDALEAYYKSALWKKDFAADEAGLIPPDVKRGVLSEDGLCELLDRVREAKERGLRDK